ncbi:MAG: LysR family transcriptional regulator [Chloroflexi bacterium]|nr:LysR family transcriptional regulator [Chloroflexota bacterium]MCI0577950.1 LysR family transcriptional regulator [Chloroflexota bacterium]MCI0646112.1 LysR family transcriptional regulator [Chloroflexota bacterium]MCI0731562.1 LysR family transcriptional regulator [Chloroflexota bacterium]
MRPEFNLWIEVDGQVALSIWRVRLLRAVAETGSISAAADKIGVPYRVAWQKINEMETRLGVKLVETRVGGPEGGGATLTATAELYIEQFTAFSAAVARCVQQSYPTTWPGSEAAGG